MTSNDNRTIMDKQNDVVIEDITLSSQYATEPLSIVKSTMSVSIFEDILSHFLIGEITLVDGINLIDKYPIVGREIIEITFRTPLYSDTKKVKLRVVGQKTRAKPENGVSDIITLRLVSEAAYTDSVTQVSETLEGTNSELVTDLLDRFYPQKIESSKVSDTGSTRFKYVFPFQRPSQMIDQMITNSSPSESQSPDENSGYVFYESLTKYNYVPVNFLIEQDPKAIFSNIKILRVPKTQAPNDSRLEFDDRSAVMLQRVNGISSMDRMNQIKVGAFSSVNYFHDLTSKEWGKEQYNHSEDSNSYVDFTEKDLNENTKLPKRKDVVYKDEPLNFSPSVIHFFPQHTNVQGPDFKKNSTDFDIKRHRMSNMSLLGDTQYQIETTGSSNITVGDTVFLRLTNNIPNTEMRTQGDFDEEKSGVYLIKSIQHFFTIGDKQSQTYKTAMRVVRNYRIDGVTSKSYTQFEGVNNA
tara:strand:- start:11451 stop:12854 length:1404 start_codon:yes stop_codon:yes gene_type:complete